MLQDTQSKTRSKIYKTETYILLYNLHSRLIWTLLKHYRIRWRIIYTIDIKIYNSHIVTGAKGTSTQLQRNVVVEFYRELNLWIPAEYKTSRWRREEQRNIADALLKTRTLALMHHTAQPIQVRSSSTNIRPSLKKRPSYSLSSIGRASNWTYTRLRIARILNWAEGEVLLARLNRFKFEAFPLIDSQFICFFFYSSLCSLLCLKVNQWMIWSF